MAIKPGVIGMTERLLSIEGLTKQFVVDRRLLQGKTQRVNAVNGIDLTLLRGETVALVGESGCGKSTTARLLMGAYPPSAGKILLHQKDGSSIDTATLRGHQRKRLWRDVQLIFQDPYTSLNPRMTVKQIIAEPLKNFGLLDNHQCEERVAELLTLVGLKPAAMVRYPHAFSGGQRQRIGIARALAVKPRLVIGDEPVSALDVSVGAQILNLFNDLKRELGLTYLLITHDLSVVRHSADRVAVMYLGRIVEENTTEELFARPRHPYTKALLSSIPAFDKPDHERIILQGEVASARNMPQGCHFHPRCPHAQDQCRQRAPEVNSYAPNKGVACHFPLEPLQ